MEMSIKKMKAKKVYENIDVLKPKEAKDFLGKYFCIVDSETSLPEFVVKLIKVNLQFEFPYVFEVIYNNTDITPTTRARLNLMARRMGGRSHILDSKEGEKFAMNQESMKHHPFQELDQTLIHMINLKISKLDSLVTFLKELIEK